MEVVVARVGQQRILRQRVKFMPRRRGPGGNSRVYGRARRAGNPRLESASCRIGLGDVQAVVVALEAHDRRIRPHVHAVGPGPDHAEHVVGGPHEPVFQIDAVDVGPQHAGPHVHGTVQFAIERDRRVLVFGEDRMRQIEVRRSPDRRNAVEAPLHVHLVGADEIAFIHVQSVGRSGNVQMLEPDAVGSVQMESGVHGPGEAVAAAARQRVRAAHDVDLPGGILGRVAGVQVADHRRSRGLVEAGVHVDHVARLEVVGFEDFGNPAFGVRPRNAGIRGIAGRVGIDVVAGRFVVDVVVDRPVFQHEGEFAGRGDGGLRFVHHAPPRQGRRQAGTVPDHAAQLGRDARRDQDRPGRAVVEGHFQAHRPAGGGADGPPGQRHLVGRHAPAVQGQQMQGGVGVRPGGPRRAAVQADVNPLPVVGRLVRPGQRGRIARIDQRRCDVVLHPVGVGNPPAGAAAQLVDMVRRVDQQRIAVVGMQVVAGGQSPGADRLVDDRHRRLRAVLLLAENAPARPRRDGIVVGVERAADAQPVDVFPRHRGQHVVPNRGAVLAADQDGRPGRFPEHVVLDHREHGVGCLIPVDHAHAGRDAVGDAIGDPQVRPSAQQERDVAQAHRHPFRRGPLAIVERHPGAQGVGNDDVPHLDADCIVGLDADGAALEVAVEHRAVHQRMGAPLEHDRIAGQGSGRIGLGYPPRHAGYVDARVDVDDVAALQVVLGQQRVEIRHRRQRRQAGIRVVADRIAIDVVVL